MWGRWSHAANSMIDMQRRIQTSRQQSSCRAGSAIRLSKGIGNFLQMPVNVTPQSWQCRRRRLPIPAKIFIVIFDQTRKICRSIALPFYGENYPRLPAFLQNDETYVSDASDPPFPMSLTRCRSPGDGQPHLITSQPPSSTVALNASISNAVGK
jgi:hypothetical protein